MGLCCDKFNDFHHEHHDGYYYQHHNGQDDVCHGIEYREQYYKEENRDNIGNNIGSNEEYYGYMPSIFSKENRTYFAPYYPPYNPEYQVIRYR